MSIINTSYGELRFETSLTNNQIMQAALDLGSLVVTASGNAKINIGGYNTINYLGTSNKRLMFAVHILNLLETYGIIVSIR
ncbi:MAG: hypothetical protein OXF08_11660 [Bacteroidetes bacterium]|nr:hypothetical protein [Bacteroidota bacterium]